MSPQPSLPRAARAVGGREFSPRGSIWRRRELNRVRDEVVELVDASGAMRRSDDAAPWRGRKDPGAVPRVRSLLDRRPDSPSRRDVSAQLDNLIFPGFIAAIPEPHFGRLETYLRAVEMRIISWASNPAREASGLELITELEDAYSAAIDHFEIGHLPPAAEDVGWMLEELRVSLFAQQLGTSRPVSAKRLRTAIRALG